MNTRAIVFTIVSSFVFFTAGCGGGKDEDPQPVNVKKDPRLKITGDGGGNRNEGETGALNR